MDQLQVLLAVVEAGSFTGAAKRLGRAVSAISYAIDALEAQLGIPVFSRGSTRKPRLTEAGAAIHSEARAVALSVEAFRARVKGLHDGLEPEVSLVVDYMYPSDHLAVVLEDFHAAFPTVPLRLTAQPLNGVERAVRHGDAGIGVGSLFHMDITGMREFEIEPVPIFPVAAPNHPLASTEEAWPSALPHVQLVLSDQPDADAEGRTFGLVSQATWRIGDLNLKRKLLLRGIGWGSMPEPMVRADLEAGRLVRLTLKDYRGGDYQLQVVHKIETPPGPAGQWLIERLRAPR